MHIKIALLAGDGIGPEVINQAVKVSDAIANKFNHTIEWKPALTGATAIDAVGDPYPEETHQICLDNLKKKKKRFTSPPPKKMDPTKTKYLDPPTKKK